MLVSTCGSPIGWHISGREEQGLGNEKYLHLSCSSLSPKASDNWALARQHKGQMDFISRNVATGPEDYCLGRENIWGWGRDGGEEG